MSYNMVKTRSDGSARRLPAQCGTLLAQHLRHAAHLFQTAAALQLAYAIQLAQPRRKLRYSRLCDCTYFLISASIAAFTASLKPENARPFTKMIGKYSNVEDTPSLCPCGNR